MKKASFWTRMWEDDFERKEREMAEYQEQAAEEAAPFDAEAKRCAAIRDFNNRLSPEEVQGLQNKTFLQQLGKAAGRAPEQPEESDEVFISSTSCTLRVKKG